MSGSARSLEGEVGEGQHWADPIYGGKKHDFFWGGYPEIMKFLDEVFTYYNVYNYIYICHDTIPGTGMLPSFHFYLSMYSCIFVESFLYLSIYLYSDPYYITYPLPKIQQQLWIAPPL